ncbi:MAG TPA: succinate dehydrogenase, cytochrome b556 subunit [Caulobacteraceae bacterium]|nr:succinate dehydrogenase, cytochrome b556 subunit [Caulobacteraceae bacterium]
MAEASPGARTRPLSPHVQIWRWHVTMATSILHRVTGVGLYGGALILAGWAFALAAGEGAYVAYTGLLGSLLGKLVLFGITVCAFYHLGNGIRHLVWDAGRGFDLKTANSTGWAALAFGVVAAVAVWALVLTGAVR